MAVDPPAGGELTALNGRLHELLDERFFEAVEALTALELERAEALWGGFRRLLEAHAEAEESVVFPHYGRLGGYPRGAAPELYDADHVSLARVGALGDEAMAALVRTRERPRRAMVRSLDVFVRVGHVLEHHTLREQTHLYPALDRALDAEARGRLALALEAAARAR